MEHSYINNVKCNMYCITSSSAEAGMQLSIIKYFPAAVHSDNILYNRVSIYNYKHLNWDAISQVSAIPD